MTSITEWLTNYLPLIGAILITIACAFCVCVTLYRDRKRHKNVKYYGKHYLYNFLKEHDYTVPMKKRMKYSRFGGTECLCGEILEVDEILEQEKIIYIECFHVAEIICITIYDTEEVEGVVRPSTEIEFSKYVNGELYERNINIPSIKLVLKEQAEKELQGDNDI